MNRENFTVECFNHGPLPNSYDKWLILETEAHVLIMGPFLIAMTNG